MKLIVGLGNPGKEYENTRHNVGFIILDNYVNENQWKKKDNYLIATDVIKGEKVIFLKPLTFMNLSGDAVIKVVNYYDISIDDILVIHDDLDLPKETFKFKINSSSGGHNGIKSIINVLHSEGFAQLKIGIDKSLDIPISDYVLGKLSHSEKNFLLNNFNEVIDYYLTYGLESSMMKYNKR